MILALPRPPRRRGVRCLGWWLSVQGSREPGGVAALRAGAGFRRCRGRGGGGGGARGRRARAGRAGCRGCLARGRVSGWPGGWWRVRRLRAGGGDVAVLGGRRGGGGAARAGHWGGIRVLRRR